MYEAVQVTLLAWPSRNSFVDSGWIVKGEKEPEIQMVNVKNCIVNIKEMYSYIVMVISLNTHHVHSAFNILVALIV